jgi:hypothetical protein
MEKYQLMPFPKREWLDMKKELKKCEISSSTRCCQQLGIYKVGDIFMTPWGDKIKITKVVRYSKAEDIPTWHLMDKGMKISVKKGIQYGGSKWDHVMFKKIK